MERSFEMLNTDQIKEAIDEIINITNPDGAVVILPTKDGAMVLEVGDIPDIMRCFGFDVERRREFMQAVRWIVEANGSSGTFPRNKGVAKYRIDTEPGTIEKMRKRDLEDEAVLMEHYASKYYPSK